MYMHAYLYMCTLVPSDDTRAKCIVYSDYLVQVYSVATQAPELLVTL